MNADKKPDPRDVTRFKHTELTDCILSVFYDVYNELGFGFLESVYGKAMTIALTSSGLAVATECPVSVWFRDQQIADFRADLVVNQLVLVELKAVRSLEPSHEAQTLNYLRATDLEVALLLNFGPKPQVRRLVFDNHRKNISVNQRSSAAKGF